MKQKIKEFIKSNKLLLTLITPLIDKSIPFKIYRLFKIPITYKLFNGSSIKIYPKGQIALGIFNKRFEKHEIDLLQKIIKPRMNIVDVGANIGLYSLIASKLAGSEGRVFSFEPSKETFQRFSDNIRLNGCTNITPFNIGLGERTNEKLILRQDVGYEDGERYVFPGNQPPHVKSYSIHEAQREEEVILDTLDNCLESINLQKIDFLKIDTEGFEYYILKGAKNILRNSPEIIMLMECTEPGTLRASTTQKQVFALLEEFDLKIFYWNKMSKDFCDDEMGALNAGNVWVCRDKNQLKR